MSDETEQEIEFSEGEAAGVNLAVAVSKQSELQVVPAGELPEIDGLKRVDVKAIWGQYASKVEVMEKVALAISVKDVNDTASMSMARHTRLAFRQIRCEAENRRKELTGGLNAQVKAINTAANAFTARCEDHEERLLEQEKYAEKVEAERKATLAFERGESLCAIGVNPNAYKLGEMPEDQWEKLRTALRNAHEAKLAEERQAEEERAAQRKQEAEERERIRLENERLKAEAAAAEAEHRKFQQEAAKERERIEAAGRERERKLTAETQSAENEARKLREAAEEQRRAEEQRHQAEEAEKARVQAERIAALKAPDRQKLVAYAVAVESIEIPRMATATGEEALELIEAQMKKFVAWVAAKAAKL